MFWVFRVLWWLQHRILRRFTPAGWLVASAMAVAGVMSIDPETTVAYQAFPALLFLLMSAVAFGWFFRVRFGATRVMPRFGTAGNPLSYRIRLKNLDSTSQRDLALLEDLADSAPSFSEWKAVQLADERRVLASFLRYRRRAHPFKQAMVDPVEIPPLRPGEETEVTVQLLPLRRGVLRFRGVTIARPDPLGFFRAEHRQEVPQSLLVLPKRYPLPPLQLPGNMRYQHGGVALASSVGQSDEFVSLRDYRRGDPLRHIHWRSWAKAGKPIVKEFEDEYFVRHGLVLDTFTDDPRGDAFEEAVSIAASFACSLEIQESLLDLLFVGNQAYCFTAGRGLAHADQMLEILASVRACTEGGFERLEGLVLNHVSVISGCIVVLLDWDTQRQAFIRKLMGVGVPVLVFLLVEPGRAAEVDPGPMRNHPDAFHVLEVGKVEAGLAQLK